MRVLVELLHILIGLAAAAALTFAAAWAYPLGAAVIHWCGIVAMIATVVLGIGPLRHAWARDRGRDGGRS